MDIYIADEIQFNVTGSVKSSVLLWPILILEVKNLITNFVTIAYNNTEWQLPDDPLQNSM